MPLNRSSAHLSACVADVSSEHDGIVGHTREWLSLLGDDVDGCTGWLSGCAPGRPWDGGVPRDQFDDVPAAGCADDAGLGIIAGVMVGDVVVTGFMDEDVVVVDRVFVDDVVTGVVMCGCTADDDVDDDFACSALARGACRSPDLGGGCTSLLGSCAIARRLGCVSFRWCCAFARLARFFFFLDAWSGA